MNKNLTTMLFLKYPIYNMTTKQLYLYSTPKCQVFSDGFVSLWKSMPHYDSVELFKLAKFLGIRLEVVNEFVDGDFFAVGN